MAEAEMVSYEGVSLGRLFLDGKILTDVAVFLTTSLLLP